MVDDWLGSPATDTNGEPLGTLVELFVGKTSGAPEFGVVAERDREDRVVVPLGGARQTAGGLVLAFPAERFHTAPRMQSDVDEIPAEVGELVRDHFGIHEAATAPVPTGGDLATETETEAELTLSEEQLAVETRAHATERVRIRKHVVNEEVTVTVTLRREELIIEREPVAGTSHQAAEGDFPLGQDAAPVEFVLHAEEPVVTKRVVPVERVRIDKNTLTEERRITDTVRRERAEVEETPITQEETHR